MIEPACSEAGGIHAAFREGAAEPRHRVALEALQHRVGLPGRHPPDRRGPEGVFEGEVAFDIDDATNAIGIGMREQHGNGPADRVADKVDGRCPERRVDENPQMFDLGRKRDPVGWYRQIIPIPQ